MPLRLAIMGSTSQTWAFHPTIHGYSNHAFEGAPTPGSSPVANATDPGSNLMSPAVDRYVTFDKGKDNTVDNSEDRSGNDAACELRKWTPAERLAACVQLANPEGRTPIDVATEDRCMQLQALNGEADSAEWITKQNEVLDDSGYGKSIDGTLIHGGDQVMPPQPDAFGQQPKFAILC
ncbi:unnamed protein product [Clonostachys rhizophaga]|uniref:Uncharacterized protein n=1 Tax=Clonostachys rhizophaga TaxID=160324 RepID=A0A9N9VRZ9_9HYPO|nr:unnamed protein product [Clonostachys rhizophaga]